MSGLVQLHWENMHRCHTWGIYCTGDGFNLFLFNYMSFAFVGIVTAQMRVCVEPGLDNTSSSFQYGIGPIVSITIIVTAGRLKFYDLPFSGTGII